MIIYISNLKKSAKELLQLINTFNNVNLTQKKSVALLHTDDKWAEKIFREISPFTVVTNNIEYLGVTLAKQVEDLYDKNFKSLKKTPENGKISHALGR